MSKPQDFKIGDSRINRNGRPKKEWTWSELLEDAVEELDESGVPIKVTISKKLAAIAKRGDVSAIKMMFDRMDGMPKQQADVTSNGKTIFPVPTELIDKYELQKESNDTLE